MTTDSLNVRWANISTAFDDAIAVLKEKRKRAYQTDPHLSHLDDPFFLQTPTVSRERLFTPDIGNFSIQGTLQVNDVGHRFTLDTKGQGFIADAGNVLSRLLWAMAYLAEIEHLDEVKAAIARVEAFKSPDAPKIT